MTAARSLVMVWALACLGLCLGLPARAAAGGGWGGWAEMLFQRVTTGDLAADTMGATSFAQDSAGFLWIGTQNGLVRWDGYRFRIYHADLERPGALPDSFLQTLLVDARGQLWIGTANHGLVRYRPERDDFISADAQGLSHVSVNALMDAADGGLWVGTEGGLDHLDAASRQFTHAPMPAVQRASGASITALAHRRNGDLWIGTVEGLVHADAHGQHFQSVPLTGTRAGERRVRSLLVDSLDRVWVGLDAGVFLLDPRTGLGRVIDASDSHAAGLRRDRVACLLETAAGEVWAGTDGEGIVAIDLHTLKTRHFQRQPERSYALVNNDIWALLQDRSGTVWVGSIDSVMQVQPSARGIFTLMGGPGPARLLSSDEAGMVLPMPDGRVLIGAGFNGIDIVDPQRGRIGGLRPDPGHPDTSVPRERALAGLSAADGRLFLGTQKGLYVAPADASSVHRVQVEGRMDSAEVEALHQDAQGLWLGGIDGLWLARPSSVPRFHASAHFTKADGLSDDRVMVIVPAGPGRLWVGTRNGLNLFDEQTRHTLSIPLTGVFITSVCVGSDGRLWVGTAANGLFVIASPQSAHPDIRHLGARQGLPNDAVDTVLSDAEGRIWLSTDQGLAMVDPATLQMHALGVADGVGVAQYWVGDGARTSRGDLVFGGLGGAVVVTPAHMPAAPAVPTVRLTEVRRDDTELPAGAFDGRGPPHRLVLPPHTRGFSVEFSALEFSAQQRIRYAYRLAGFDRDWIDSDASRRIATYTNVPPGDYTLEVRAARDGSGWLDPPLRVAVVAQPAWYQTAWFLGAMALLALAAVGALVRFRTLLLVRRQRELQQLVEERTAALQASESRLARLAYFDALTGLPNRRRFAECFELAEARARREDNAFALLLVDLDRFKDINDELGHAAGDALLVETALRLRRAVREIDTVARIGGDEFAVLLEGTQLELDAEAACRRIIAALEYPVLFGAVPMATSPSIGVAFYGRNGTTLDHLSMNADKALYRAKAGGRNTWRMAAAH